MTRNELRQQFRKLRRLIPEEQQKQASQLLVDCADTHSIAKNDKIIAAYIANDGELNPSKLIHYFLGKNIKVCLPVLHPFNKKTLLFLQYEQTSKMKTNRLGISEPCLDVTKVVPIDTIDTILMPLVAFDEMGNRLGMGGGYYDRTLAYISKNQSKKSRLIGLAHEQQKVKKLPVEAWDVPLEYILTPSNLYTFK